MRVTIKRTWRRLWLGYEWVVYSSAYGLGLGYTWTKKAAERKADHCAVTLLNY